MDPIRQARLFVQVMESGNFTRAARALNVPRSTVSTVIQALENRLGARLLQRTTRQVSPTQDGLRYLEAARHLLDAFEASEQLFQDTPRRARGRLRVDMPSRIGRRLLIPALPGFLADHPEVELAFSMTDRRVDLLSEGVDCVIRVGTLEDSELVCRRIGDLSIINCASPAYLQRHGTPREPGQLAGHRMVNYAIRFPSGPARWEYRDNGVLRERELPSDITVDNAEAYIAAALAGLGLIQIPRYDVAGLIEQGRLREVMADFRPPAMPLSFLYSSRRHLPFRVRVFQQWAAERLISQGVFD